MDISLRNRVQKGVAAGGQFTAEARSESGVALSAPPTLASHVRLAVAERIGDEAETGRWMEHHQIAVDLLAQERAITDPEGHDLKGGAEMLLNREGTLGYGDTADTRYDPDRLDYSVSGGGPHETSSNQRVAIAAILDKEDPRNGVIVDMPFPLDPVSVSWTGKDGLSREAHIDRDGTVNAFLAEPVGTDEKPWLRPYSIRGQAEGSRLKETIRNALANIK